MNARLANGWQITLADLALILFLSAAAAIGPQNEPASAQAEPGGGGLLTIAADPVSVFRADGTASFDEWLSSRLTDPRERLTIIVRHAPGRRQEAFESVARMALTAQAHGFEPHMTIEPAPRDEALAVFAFAGTIDLARSLQDHSPDKAQQ